LRNLEPQANLALHDIPEWPEACF